MKQVASVCLFSLLACVANAMYAGDFCDNAPFVKLNQVISHKTSYIGVRVRTHAILKTDLKEYTIIEQAEGSGTYLLVGSDEQNSGLRNVMGKSDITNSSVSRDFMNKYEQKEGAGAAVDWSKIVYYRQERLLCGRVIKVNGRWRFAIDDSILQRSYLLNWKKKHNPT